MLNIAQRQKRQDGAAREKRFARSQRGKAPEGVPELAVRYLICENIDFGFSYWTVEHCLLCGGIRIAKRFFL